VGIVVFPDATQLDVTGPYEVFARMPDTKVYLVAATLAAIRSEQGLRLAPDATFDTVPQLDVICVPGGAGINAAMEDEALLAFVRSQARHARYVTAVANGALALAAAGLLRGYRATTHWLSLNRLPSFGAYPVDQRIVIDRNRITSGGVVAGIDVGLFIAAELFDAELAQEIQMMIEPRFTLAANDGEGIAIDALEPGTTLVVNTRNSSYRFVVLFQTGLLRVTGGALFPEATVVRFEGASAGGRAVKTGAILVGLYMEMSTADVRVRSSRVRSLSIESVPALNTGDTARVS